MLPFPRSYALIPWRFYAGCCPGDRDPRLMQVKLRALRNCRVTHFINLMEEDERDQAGRPFASYEESYRSLMEEEGKAAHFLHHPLADLGVPTTEAMGALLDAIDAALDGGAVLYLHCGGGRGRTGTVAGCWLARHGEPEPLALLQQLTEPARDPFGEVPETASQRDFVRAWQAGQ